MLRTDAHWDKLLTYSGSKRVVTHAFVFKRVHGNQGSGQKESST